MGSMKIPGISLGLSSWVCVFLGEKAKDVEIPHPQFWTPSMRFPLTMSCPQVFLQVTVKEETDTHLTPTLNIPHGIWEMLLWEVLIFIGHDLTQIASLFFFFLFKNNHFKMINDAWSHQSCFLRWNVEPLCMSGFVGGRAPNPSKTEFPILYRQLGLCSKKLTLGRKCAAEGDHIPCREGRLCSSYGREAKFFTSLGARTRELLG